jgi:hypothetical protein
VFVVRRKRKARETGGERRKIEGKWKGEGKVKIKCEGKKPFLPSEASLLPAVLWKYGPWLSKTTVRCIRLGIFYGR